MGEAARSGSVPVGDREGQGDVVCIHRGRKRVIRKSSTRHSRLTAGSSIGSEPISKDPVSISDEPCGDSR